MLEAKQPEFTKEFEKLFHKNKIDEARGLIGLHVSDNLLFHIVVCTTAIEVWDKLARLYGKVNQLKI